jgi:hypothetical protein
MAELGRHPPSPRARPSPLKKESGGAARDPSPRTRFRAASPAPPLSGGALPLWDESLLAELMA